MTARRNPGHAVRERVAADGERARLVLSAHNGHAVFFQPDRDSRREIVAGLGFAFRLDVGTAEPASAKVA